MIASSFLPIASHTLRVRSIHHALAVLTLVTTVGCCSRETVGLPSLLHPGDIDTQRAKMERFDPLPQTGFGPDVQSGRGRGFEHAIAPERRAALYTESLLEGTAGVAP